ncbi:MAG: hypothetical protein V1845_01965 [bacterium]
MKKFVTPRSRIVLSLILCGFALFLLVSLIISLVAPSGWLKELGNVLLAGTIFALLGLAIYFQTSLPTVLDLIGAAELTEQEDKKMMEAWADVVIKRQPIKEMSKKEKLVYVCIIAASFLCIIYGIADFFGAFQELRIIGAGGKSVKISHWETGFIACGVGFMGFFAAYFWRIKTVSRREEAIKKMLKEADEGKASPPEGFA